MNTKDRNILRRLITLVEHGTVNANRPFLAHVTNGEIVHALRVADAEVPCTEYRPDHNGECLNCDDLHDTTPDDPTPLHAALAAVGRTMGAYSASRGEMMGNRTKAVVTGWQRKDGYVEIAGRQCTITIESRPPTCDRGTVIAKLHPIGTLERAIDDADGWPRYYFDLERAKLECEAWLEKRGQRL